MEESRFQLNYELSDYGKLRFEYDDNLSQLEMSKQKRQAMLKSPGFYIMAAFLFLMIIWFLGSLISSTIKVGFFSAIGSHFSGLFMLIVVGLILGLSMTGSWGKFERFANGGARFTKVKDFNNQEKAIETIREAQRNSIQIYEDYFVITNSGVASVFDMSQLAEVKMESVNSKGNKNYIIKFVSLYGEEVKADVKIPNDKLMLTNLKKIFDDKLTIVRPLKVAVRPCTKSIGSLVGLTLVGLAVMGVGIGLICLHYFVIPEIPAFMGAFFIVGGLLALCGTYDFIPALKDILAPMLFGSVFIFFPISLIKMMYAIRGVELTLKAFFGSFDILSVAVVFFGFIAIILIISGIKNLIDYIKYSERKQK